MRNDSDNEANNKAINDINIILKQHGLSCAEIELPTPTGNAPEMQVYDPEEEARDGDECVYMLNNKQLDPFRKILNAVDNENIDHRYFYLDGSGGSGKPSYAQLLWHLQIRESPLHY